jgi:hypothetical protein
MLFYCMPHLYDHFLCIYNLTDKFLGQQDIVQLNEEFDISPREEIEDIECFLGE